LQDPPKFTQIGIFVLPSGNTVSYLTDVAVAGQEHPDSAIDGGAEVGDREVDPGKLESPGFVSFTEEDLANVQIIEFEFEDPNMSLKDLSFFNKSLSLTDLAQDPAPEPLQVTQPSELLFFVAILMLRYPQSGLDTTWSKIQRLLNLQLCIIPALF
jgi:hypothetical protein